MEFQTASFSPYSDCRSQKQQFFLTVDFCKPEPVAKEERLITSHHLDALWRPADVELRDGRILRQGNTNPEVQVCQSGRVFPVDWEKHWIQIHRHKAVSSALN